MEYFKKDGVPRGTPEYYVLFWIRNVSRETSGIVVFIDRRFGTRLDCFGNYFGKYNARH